MTRRILNLIFEVFTCCTLSRKSLQRSKLLKIWNWKRIFNILHAQGGSFYFSQDLSQLYAMLNSIVLFELI